MENEAKIQNESKVAARMPTKHPAHLGTMSLRSSSVLQKHLSQLEKEGRKAKEWTSS